MWHQRRYSIVSLTSLARRYLFLSSHLSHWGGNFHILKCNSLSLICNIFKYVDPYCAYMTRVRTNPASCMLCWTYISESIHAELSVPISVQAKPWIVFKCIEFKFIRPWEIWPCLNWYLQSLQFDISIRCCHLFFLLLCLTQCTGLRSTCFLFTKAQVAVPEGVYSKALSYRVS